MRNLSPDAHIAQVLHPDGVAVVLQERVALDPDRPSSGLDGALADAEGRDGGEADALERVAPDREVVRHRALAPVRRVV